MIPLLLCLLLAPAPTSKVDATVVAWNHADASTRSAALALARRAFDAFAQRRAEIGPPSHPPPLLRAPAAVFVSAMRHGAPRCCMGSLFPTQGSAAEEIIASAGAAAGRDRRFPPIQPRELSGLTLIVSIVGGLRAISQEQAESLDPLSDGLAVRTGDRYGVVLSGETTVRGRMLAWARVRAGARPGQPVQYFQLDVVRLVEGRDGLPLSGGVE